MSVSVFFRFGFSGTGSNPPFDHGPQRKSRLAVRCKPTKNPHSAKHCLAYSEQVGVNLHTWGRNGEMQNLNILTKNIAIYFGIEMINCKILFIF